MDHFEEPFVAENHGPLAIPFDEEPAFFHPEEAQEGEDFHGAAPVEESIYTDDPVRVYLREMGAVPLLTREGEVELARRMERGKLRMQKAISRSALVQLLVLEIAEGIKKESLELDNYVDLGDVEDGSAADVKKQAEMKLEFANLGLLYKKLTQNQEKLNAVALSNKKFRRRWIGKVNRCKVEVSQAIRHFPFLNSIWKQFGKEIDRAVEEINHLDAEVRKLEERGGLNPRAASVNCAAKSANGNPPLAPRWPT